MNGIIAGDGVLRDAHLIISFDAFCGGGTDTSMQMHAGENDCITIQFLEDCIQTGVGECIETGFVNDGFASER